MSGKDHLLYISSTGISTGVMTKVDMQDDLTITTGKTIAKTSYKEGSTTAQGNDGWSAETTLGIMEPMTAGQTLIMDANDNGGAAYIQVKSTKTGSMMFAGPVVLAVTEISHPKSGASTYKLSMAENGVIVRSTVV